jgi:hypothetical protein
VSVEPVHQSGAIASQGVAIQLQIKGHGSLFQIHTLSLQSEILAEIFCLTLQWRPNFDEKFF